MPERHLAIAVEAERNFDDVTKLLQKQARVPPGNDPCIGSCYEGLLTILETSPKSRDFFEQIYQNRESLTPAHFVNLFFRSIQHIQLNLKEDRRYLDFESSNQWLALLNEILDSDDKNTLEELLLTKDTITTKYQRYAGPQAILSAYWNGSPITVADFGCGANVGLPGIELGIPFQEVHDETPNQLLLRELDRPINLQTGLAVDKENPEDPEVKAWSFACSFYPKEIKSSKNENGLASEFRSSKNIGFLKADLISRSTMDIIPKNNFDTVILSTVLYQRSKQERDIIMQAAEAATRPTGIIIIQDFAVRDPKNLNSLEFDGAWGGYEYGYRTFVLKNQPNQDLLEVLHWSDGRCQTVRPGRNFEVVFH